MCVHIWENKHDFYKYKGPIYTEVLFQVRNAHGNQCRHLRSCLASQFKLLCFLKRLERWEILQAFYSHIPSSSLAKAYTIFSKAKSDMIIPFLSLHIHKWLTYCALAPIIWRKVTNGAIWNRDVSILSF